MRETNDGPRGMDFRIIDALGAHSAFSYTLASPPKKPAPWPSAPRKRVKRLRWVWRRGFDPSWRLDETYVKVRGKQGNGTVAFFDADACCGGSVLAHC